MAHPPAYDPYYMPPPVPGTNLYSSTVGLRDRSPGIRTLFVSGLPDDIKAREIHNLFRRRPGFESCQLKYTGRGNQVVAFATFVSHQAAMAALHAVNGVTFDPHNGSTLHIELARENSRRKRRPGSGPYVVIDNRVKDSPDAQGNSSDDGESDDSSGSKNPESADGDNSERSAAAATNDTVASRKEASEKTSNGWQPCSTLFIANLGPNCTEDELKQVFSQYPGFTCLMIRARGGMPVAFADFEEVEQATEAMTALQGSELSSSDRGGMSIEYARSKMRKPSMA